MVTVMNILTVGIYSLTWKDGQAIFLSEKKIMTWFTEHSPFLFKNRQLSCVWLYRQQ